MLQIDKNKMPKHVAIIMDGNGRWAKSKGGVRTFGHKQGVKAVKKAIEFCDENNIEFLTLYTFSTENWNRPSLEIKTLMTLLVSTIRKEAKKLNEKNIRVKTIGNIKQLPKSVQKELNDLVEETKNNKRGTLVLALSYGSKEEIIRAVSNITKDVLGNEICLEDITENLFDNYLYTKDIPPVDLLIRTSGEQRISNFLLWQIAYAELYFTDIFWPDFDADEFFKAIYYYQSRERRFGKTSEQLNIS